MKRRLRSEPAGVALVVTLMMMSVLVMMVVGLAGVMRNEQAAARNLTYQVLAEQMAEIGAQEAMGVILAGSISSVGRPGATGPGWMTSNGVVVPLYSSNATGLLKNLEEIGTNSLILSLPDGVRGRVMAAWTNVVAPGGNAARPIGRYAWWVDDEGTKADLNAVGPNNSLYLPLLTNFPLAVDRLFVSDPVTGATNQATSDWAQGLRTRTNAIFTPESIKDTNLIRVATTNATNPLVFRRAKGHLTTWSSHTDLTPWGTAKFNLADLTNTTLYPTATSAVAALKTALMTNALTNVFGANANLGKKYGGGSATATNTGNHGDLVVEQIAKNIMAAQGRPFVCTNFGGRRDNLGATHPNRHRNGLPREIASHYIGPYIEEVRVRVDGSVGGGSAIAGRLGILVQVVNPYNQTFSNFTLMVQPRKFRFQVVPVPGQVADNADFTSASSDSPLNGFTGPRSAQQNIAAGPGWYIGPEWYENIIDPWPTNSTFTNVINSIGPKTRLSIPFEQRVSFSLGNNKRAQGMGSAYVILDSVKLCRGLNNFTDVIDWVSLDDFSQPGNYENSRSGALSDIGQLNLTASTVATLTTLDAANFGGLGGNVLGLRRIDPQARWPVSFWSTNNRGLMKENAGWPDTVQAWTRNANLPVGSLVTNTGIPYLQADPAPGLLDITSHPHFVSGFYVTNGLTSVAQLGAIHTGIPWRTLRLQPTSALELAQGPPDWVVLEMFTATNATNPRSMVNLNAVPLAFGGTATNANGFLSTRAWSVAAAMGPAGTNLPSSATNQAASNGVPVSLAQTFGGYSNLAALASNLTVALTNSKGDGSWSGKSGWGTYRATSTVVSFPSNGLLFKGELLEMPGVAEEPGVAEDPARSEDVIEGRLRAYLDLVTTRSDVFTVWSAGQGLVVNTNLGNRTNVMGEVRKQTVFQRVPATNASGSWQVNAQGQVTNWVVRVLYTRNHVVE